MEPPAPPLAADVVPIFLRVPRAEVAYVKFVFESYEGVAVMRTLDRHVALLVAIAVPDFVAQARAITASLAAEGVCTEVPSPAGSDADLLGPEPDDDNAPR
ncbi:MAG: DUF4911 domain-containing protein [Candidatus Binatia bacterium]